jgi:hypothetical protein
MLRGGKNDPTATLEGMSRILCLLLVSLTLIASEADERYAKLREALRIPGDPGLSWRLGDRVKDAVRAEPNDPRLAPKQAGGQRGTELDGKRLHRLQARPEFKKLTAASLYYNVFHNPYEERRFFAFRFHVPEAAPADMAEFTRLRTAIEGIYSVKIPLDGTPVKVDDLEFVVLKGVETWAPNGIALLVIDHLGQGFARVFPPDAPQSETPKP